MATNQQFTRQLLEKIPNFPCLYRYKVNASYYGAKKIPGKRKEHSLKTTERKLAERRLKIWIADLDKIDGNAAKTTLPSLLDKFTAINQGKPSKTKATNAAIVNVFRKNWPHGIDLRVSKIKPSHLNAWLAQPESRLKNTTCNRYCGFLKQRHCQPIGNESDAILRGMS
jgi:hypothetical protein